MQNLDQYLITNHLHVRIYSVLHFLACYLHRYVILLLSIRLLKLKGIASAYFCLAYIAVYFNTDRFHDRNMLIVEDMHILYITFMFICPIDIFLEEKLLTCKTNTKISRLQSLVGYC